MAFVAVVGLAAGACALCIGWGLNLFGFVPFAVLGNVIFFNNFVMSVVLAPLLLRAVYPRVRAAGLRYRRPGAAAGAIARGAPPRARARRGRRDRRIPGRGNVISTGHLAIAALATDPPGTRAAQVGVGVAPFMLLIIIGLVLL